MTATASPSPPAPEAAEAFADRLAQIIDHGAIAVMVALGHRTRLFEVMADSEPRDSAAVAARAGLAERYVREWLAVMTTGGIVTYDPVRRHYRLPPEQAASLTRAGTLGNLAVYAQHIALMGQVQEHILTCFRSGAGTTYEDYPHFHSVMAEDSEQSVLMQLFEAVLPLAPELSQRLEAGGEALDAGCGRGAILLALAQRYPASRFTGYDLCPDAIDFARHRARGAGLDNLHFAVRDLTDFDERERYDCLFSFDAVHDQRDPQDLLRRLRRSLRPGGIYLMQDIGGSAELENNLDFPMASLLYAISCIHCTPISLGQGGAGLGTMWGWETAAAMLRQAGFGSVEHHRLPHDPMNIWFVGKP